VLLVRPLNEQQLYEGRAREVVAPVFHCALAKDLGLLRKHKWIPRACPHEPFLRFHLIVAKEVEDFVICLPMPYSFFRFNALLKN
jgi:hypothetical protein